jgi:hypothetical protein
VPSCTKHALNHIRLVEQKGGLQACEENDKILKELNELENKSTATIGPQSAKGTSITAHKSSLEDLYVALRRFIFVDLVLQPGGFNDGPRRRDGKEPHRVLAEV